MKIIVTGAAGFIGFHLINKLIQNKNYKFLGLTQLIIITQRRLKNLE